MTCIYAKPYLDIYLLQQGRRTALEVCWRAQAQVAQLREGSIQALLLARRYRVESWISNDAALGSLSPADAEWAQTMLHSLRHDLFVTRFALLESAHPRNQQLLQPVTAEFTAAESPLQLRRFTDIGQARRWALG